MSERVSAFVCRTTRLVKPSAGKELQSKAEKEAAEKYQAGLALLQELEAKDKKRAEAA